jgi:hypothetical protein
MMRLKVSKRILATLMVGVSLLTVAAFNVAPVHAASNCARSQDTCFWSGTNEAFTGCDLSNAKNHSVWFYVPNVCGFTAKSMQEFGTSSVWLYDKAANTAVCIKANGSDGNMGAAYGYAYIKYNTSCGSNPPTPLP